MASGDSRPLSPHEAVRPHALFCAEARHSCNVRALCTAAAELHSQRRSACIEYGRLPSSLALTTSVTPREQSPGSSASIFLSLFPLAKGCSKSSRNTRKPCSTGTCFSCVADCGQWSWRPWQASPAPLASASSRLCSGAACRGRPGAEAAEALPGSIGLTCTLGCCKSHGLCRSLLSIAALLALRQAFEKSSGPCTLKTASTMSLRTSAERCQASSAAPPLLGLNRPPS